MRTLRLIDLHRGADCLVAACALDDLRFHVTVWYADVDLEALARVHGELFERICVHVALFQLNAACSLAPDAIELGRYAKHLTPEFATLWRAVFRNVWAQWRYEHDLPAYEGPRFVDALAPPSPPGRVGGSPEAPLLLFFGGGKDSLVAAKLLERGQLPFAALGYSHSVYGPAEAQHALIDRAAAATARVRAERQYVIDDLLDAPVARLRPALGVKYILAAETPASVFAALPLALARGYRELVVAHERSANTPNLIWNGEGVNHQWGKSFAAEQLLDGYIRTSLLEDVRYFSLLQPVHDEVIFELLARDAELVPLTHSCNVQKPWCGACPKCVYVWLQLAAHVPRAIVDATFGRDLSAGNDRIFRQLLGLEALPPFDCVGSAAEARLALAGAIANGWTNLRRFDAPAPRTHAFRELGPHAMPDHVAARVMPQLMTASTARS